MYNNLIGTAMSGINAAQLSLSVTGNNIANFNVAGYSRQSALLAQNGGLSIGNGFIGNGVHVTGIKREYNQFITTQLRGAQTLAAAQKTHFNHISQIDNLLSGTNTVATGLGDFFKNMQNVVNDAGDDAARQSVLGAANALVNQFNSTDKYLRDMENGANQQLSDSAAQINTYSQQIAKLNGEITKLRASGGGEPNALLDQRDQLVTELNKLVEVRVTQQDGDAYTVTFANGLALVQGNTAYEVAALPSSGDPSRLTLGYDNGRGVSEIPESQLTKGSVGGVFKFRNESLDGARNQLGQLALVLADSFNKIHREGFDIHGEPGGDFFSFSGGRSVSNTRNTGNASLSVAYTDTSKVKASDYRVEFDGTEWQVTRLSDNAKVPATVGEGPNGEPTLSFDGLEIGINGTPQQNDSFIIKPVSDVASSLKVAISDSAKFAAAGSPDEGPGDNDNVKKLFDLQTQKVVDGKASLSDAYASLVNNIGNQTAAAKASSATQNSIVEQLEGQQQSISGVNIDEEAGDLLRFSQYYSANAKVLQTATELLDTILNIR